jgi:hypothetical protein
LLKNRRKFVFLSFMNVDPTLLARTFLLDVLSMVALTDFRKGFPKMMEVC